MRWAYCPLCDLFAMEPTPTLSGRARQELEEAMRSYAKLAAERDRAAVAARDAQATPLRPS